MRQRYLHIRSLLLGLCLLALFALPEGTAFADNFPVIGTLHAGRAPEALAVDTETHMLYIGYEGPGVVVGFDPLKGNVQWRTPLGDVVTDVQVDSTNHHVFAATTSYRQQKSQLVMLDGATGHVLYTTDAGFGDNGIALDAKRQRVYIAGSDTNMILSFTFVSGWQSGSVQVQTEGLGVTAHPQGLGVNSSMGRLYVADALDHQIRVVDEDTDKVLATIPVGNVPLHPIRVDEKSGRVYVVCSTSQELDVIDGKKNVVIARVPTPPYPEGLAINTVTGRIYVAGEGEQENGSGGRGQVSVAVTVIDGQSLAVLGTYPIGRAPDGVEADPALHRVYVSAEESDAVVEISDNPNMPLISITVFHQAESARQAVSWLQQASLVTSILMLVTFVAAILGVLLPRWRARETPQTQPADVSSRSETHSLPL